MVIYSKDLDYFVGKFCTVFVPMTNWRFQEENEGKTIQYFCGVVYKINELHVWLELNGSNTCFSMESIISMSVEPVVAETDPEYEKLSSQSGPVLVNEFMPSA